MKNLESFLIIRSVGMDCQARGKKVRIIHHRVRLYPHDPDNRMANMNRCVALMHLRRFDEVIVACDRIIQRDPEEAAARMNKCLALAQLGRDEELVQACEWFGNRPEAWKVMEQVLDAARKGGFTLRPL